MTAVSGPVISVPDQDLAGLRDRLRAARWAEPYPPVAGGAWAAGTDPAWLRRLAGYWAAGYDWRRHEAEINALPWHVADLTGADKPLFYLRFDAEPMGPAGGTGHLPLVLTNGWPSSFLELIGLARRLSGPAAWGGDPADAFTVIVPCLPGFPFSPQPGTLPGPVPTHELWHRLMHDELGFTRYGAHGGDLGGRPHRPVGRGPPRGGGRHPRAVRGRPASLRPGHADRRGARVPGGR